jgi:hypothetical protein
MRNALPGLLDELKQLREALDAATIENGAALRAIASLAALAPEQPDV